MSTYRVFGKTARPKIDRLTGPIPRATMLPPSLEASSMRAGSEAGVIVSINEPRPHYYASIVACPVFKRIIQKSASIMDISPSITVASKGGTGNEGI